jgi:hypothetical protein
MTIKNPIPKPKDPSSDAFSIDKKDLKEKKDGGRVKRKWITRISVHLPRRRSVAHPSLQVSAGGSVSSPFDRIEHGFDSNLGLVSRDAVRLVHTRPNEDGVPLLLHSRVEFVGAADNRRIAHEVNSPRQTILSEDILPEHVGSVLERRFF